jgi:hypothetical protein
MTKAERILRRAIDTGRLSVESVSLELALRGFVMVKVPKRFHECGRCYGRISPGELSNSDLNQGHEMPIKGSWV